MMDVVSGICHIGDDLFTVLRNSFNLTEEILAGVVQNLRDEIPWPHNAASVSALVRSLLNSALLENAVEWTGSLRGRGPTAENQAPTYALKPEIRSGNDLKTCVCNYVLQLDKPPPPAPTHKPSRRHSNSNATPTKYSDRRTPKEKILGLIHSHSNEMLCPRTVHDTVACCVFAMLSHYPDVTHKELLDGVMYTQWLHEQMDDSEKPEMWKELMNFKEEAANDQPGKAVSRTKMRGVIGLLKQSGVVCSVRDPTDTERDSQASESDASSSGPTKVKLGFGVRTFDDVRIREDTKIKDAIIECGLAMDEEERAQYTWTLRDYRTLGPKYLQLAAELVQVVYSKHTPVQLTLAHDRTKQQREKKTTTISHHRAPRQPAASAKAQVDRAKQQSPTSYASAVRDSAAPSKPDGSSPLPQFYEVVTPRNSPPSPPYRVAEVAFHSPIGPPSLPRPGSRVQSNPAAQWREMPQGIEARIALMQQQQFHRQQQHQQVRAFQRAGLPYRTQVDGDSSLWSGGHSYLPNQVAFLPLNKQPASPLPGVRYLEANLYRLF